MATVKSNLWIHLSLGATCFILFLRFCKGGSLCGTPGKPVDGYYYPVKQLYQKSDRILYNCNNNHLVTGGKERTCLDNGIWSGTVPTCSKPAHLQLPQQSSTEKNYEAQKAIDTDYNTCSRTALEATPSTWKGVLNNESTVIAVRVVFNIEEPNPTHVYIVSESMEKVLCGIFDGNSGASGMDLKKEFFCPTGTRGKLVMLERAVGQAPYRLSVCEVQVFITEETNCLVPDLPANASGMKRYSNFRSTYKYECHQGYRLEGSPEATCINGTWHPRAPSCVKVVCIPPPETPHGNVTLISAVAITQEGIPLGAMANYVCLEGFRFRNSRTESIVCTETGHWSREPPQCIPVECPRLTPRGLQGRVVYPNGTQFGGVALLRCDEGYRPAKDRFLACTSKGTWTAGVLRCSYLKCPHPKHIRNFHMEFIDGDTFYRHRINITCLAGSNIGASHIVNCTAAGNWSLDTSLLCNSGESTCPTQPPSIANGYWTQSEASTSDNTVGTVMAPTCIHGYHLSVENVTSVCLSNGSWSDTNVVCLEEGSMSEMKPLDWFSGMQLIAAVLAGGVTYFIILMLVKVVKAVRRRNSRPQQQQESTSMPASSAFHMPRRLSRQQPQNFHAVVHVYEELPDSFPMQYHQPHINLVQEEPTTVRRPSRRPCPPPKLPQRRRPPPPSLSKDYVEPFDTQDLSDDLSYEDEEDHALYTEPLNSSSSGELDELEQDEMDVGQTTGEIYEEIDKRKKGIKKSRSRDDHIYSDPDEEAISSSSGAEDWSYFQASTLEVCPKIPPRNNRLISVDSTRSHCSRSVAEGTIVENETYEDVSRQDHVIENSIYGSDGSGESH